MSTEEPVVAAPSPLPVPNAPELTGQRRATSVELVWSFPEGTTPPDGVKFKLDVGDASWLALLSPWVTASASLTQPRFTVTGLTAGTTYTFRVCAGRAAAAAPDASGEAAPAGDAPTATSPTAAATTEDAAAPTGEGEAAAGAGAAPEADATPDDGMEWGEWSASSAYVTTLTEVEDVEVAARLAAEDEARNKQVMDKLMLSQAEFAARKAKQEEQRRQAAEAEASAQAKRAELLARQLEELTTRQAKAEQLAAETALQAEALAEAKRVSDSEKAALEAKVKDLEAEREAQRQADLAAAQRLKHAAEEELRESQARASAGDAAASAATAALEQKSQEMNELLRFLRYKDSLLRSLQGAGPNPRLEAELVEAGWKREDVRFFIEVHGDSKPELLGLLQRHRSLTSRGFDADGVREALTVTQDGASDEAVLAYLRTYAEKMASHKRFEALLCEETGSPVAAPSVWDVTAQRAAGDAGVEASTTPHLVEYNDEDCV